MPDKKMNKQVPDGGHTPCKDGRLALLLPGVSLTSLNLCWVKTPCQTAPFSMQTGQCCGFPAFGRYRGSSGFR